MADIVRESVAEYLARHVAVPPAERRERALKVVGRIGSGTPDVAREQDRYLDDIYGHGDHEG